MLESSPFCFPSLGEPLLVGVALDWDLVNIRPHWKRTLTIYWSARGKAGTPTSAPSREPLLAGVGCWAATAHSPLFFSSATSRRFFPSL